MEDMISVVKKLRKEIENREILLAELVAANNSNFYPLEVHLKHEITKLLCAIMSLEEIE